MGATCKRPEKVKLNVNKGEYGMLKKLLKLFVALGMVITFGLTGLQSASANQLTFSVEPTLPDNQVNDKDGFFNLLMQPGQVQDLHLKYSNNSGKTITITTKVASATTNINGVVEYGANKIKADKTLKYNMADLVEFPKEVEVKSGESKDVVVRVKMPDADYPGIIAGGLTFSDQAADAANQKNTSKSTAVKNIYGFQLGLLMRQSNELNNVFPTKMVESEGLKLHKVQAAQVNYRNVINANLQNPLPVYVNQMAISAKVYSASNNKLLYESKNNSMQMAPNSNFDYPISLGDGKKLAAGKYRLKMTVYAYKDGEANYKTKEFDKKETTYQYRWKFDKQFTVTDKTAGDLNKKDVTIQHIDWVAILVGIALLLLILAGGLWLVLWKRRKNNAEVTIEEAVTNQAGEDIVIQRTTTMREYKQMLKQHKSVRLIEKE